MSRQIKHSQHRQSTYVGHEDGAVGHESPDRHIGGSIAGGQDYAPHWLWTCNSDHPNMPPAASRQYRLETGRARSTTAPG
jgi:hypothetical protein